MLFCTAVLVSQSAGIPCPLELSMPDSYWQFMLGNSSHLEEECPMFKNETKESYLNQKDSDSFNESSVTPFAASNHSCQLQPTFSEFYHQVPTQSCDTKLIDLSLASAYAIPTMVFSFQCHASLLPIYAELQQSSKRKMQLVACIAIGIVFVMYNFASLFGYFTFKVTFSPTPVFTYIL